MKVLGVDPGHRGALVLFDGKNFFKWWPMPIVKVGKDTSVSFERVRELLNRIKQSYQGPIRIYLERAKPMAMGSKHAFNYGRDFGALEIAIGLTRLPVTYVEPSTWSKVMHEGVSADLKAKAKSLVAVKRLYPKLSKNLPVNKKGALLDGPIDALLIAGYALRAPRVRRESQDFF